MTFPHGPREDKEAQMVAVCYLKHNLRILWEQMLMLSKQSVGYLERWWGDFQGPRDLFSKVYYINFYFLLSASDWTKIDVISVLQRIIKPLYCVYPVLRRKVFFFHKLRMSIYKIQLFRLHLLKCKYPSHATNSSILAWKIPWTEKPGRPQSTASQRSRTQLNTHIHTHTHTHTHTCIHLSSQLCLSQTFINL